MTHIYPNPVFSALAADAHFASSLGMYEHIEIRSRELMPAFAQVGRPARMAAFVGAIPHVVGLRSYFEMFRIKAGGVVAFMENYVISIQVCAEKYISRKLMRAIQLLISKALHPITIRIFGSGPVPAASFRVNHGIANHASY